MMNQQNGKLKILPICNDDIEIELTVVCDGCKKPMDWVGSNDNDESYTCAYCGNQITVTATHNFDSDAFLEAQDPPDRDPNH